MVSKDPYVKFQHVTIPVKFFQELEAPALVRAKHAVTKLDFSEDDGRYIEMCSQVIDKDNNISQEQFNEDIFVIWDIMTNRFEEDAEIFAKSQWMDWSLSSAINARYIDRKFARETDDEEKKKFILEQSYMTQVARMGEIDIVICGSVFGEIFAFRWDALTCDKQKVLDFKFDRVLKREMAVSKAFDALTSMIQSINIYDDQKVFVTGNND